ncbi:uncharacterized protein LOC132739245 [Ruditapes philippinarum]|uniref:uncharacterized protein LOC132739245 n=1 Tax=Ruditapes philippinarum TaxID=129788 RepID=UPI00295BEAC0|nr:uncharacterized protein LOC132739245 [Ruditapes philippinarum]XP_060582892.1 uncharacterized protein LOC132739245 [Ruditapes philippinarum]
MTRIFGTVVVVLLVFAPGVLTCRQIYFSDVNDNDDLNCDLGYDLYPVVNLSDTCPFQILDFCNDVKFQREIREDYCELHRLCLNGTLPQCVQNIEPPAYNQAILICVPIGLQCEPFSRFVVYRIMNGQNMYRLCKKKCADGYYHATNPGSCFNHCSKNNNILIHKKSTPTSAAVVYCNYNYGKCNPNKPKLFEFSEVDDGCSSNFDIRCPSGQDRLSDCSCEDKCQEGSVRNATNDFKCEPSSPQETKFTPQLIVKSSTKKLQVSWTFPENSHTVVNFIEIGYKAVKAARMKKMSPISGASDPSIDIDGLIPGQLYYIQATFYYNSDNESETKFVDVYTATNPLPILNLKSELHGRNVTLFWDEPINSVHGQFKIEYKMVARNPKTSWNQVMTTFNNRSFERLFPGEEYEFRVYAVSNTSLSEKTTCNQIIPPLPPAEIRIETLAYTAHNYEVSWSKYDSKSHVEGWLLSYNSSDDNGKEINVSRSASGERIYYKLNGLQGEQTYTVMVKGKVKDVFSTPTISTIETPRDLRDEIDHSVRSVATVVYAIGIAVILVAVGVVAVIAILLKSSAGRSFTRIINRFSIRDINTNVTGSNVNVNRVLENLIPGHHTRSTSETTSEASVISLSNSSDGE